ncbi:MAG: CAP domain-containing protein [Dermatophilaceae bacterium]
MNSAPARSTGKHAAPRHTDGARAASPLFQRRFLGGILALGVIALLLVVTSPGIGTSGSGGGSQLAAAAADPESDSTTSVDTDASEGGTASATATTISGATTSGGTYCFSVNIKSEMADGPMTEAFKSLRRVCAEMAPSGTPDAPPAPTTPAPAPTSPAPTSPAPTPESDSETAEATETVEQPAEPEPEMKPAPKPEPQVKSESKSAAPSAPTGMAGEVISLVNAERADAGCDPVKAESRLTKAAQGHSNDMAAKKYMEHDSLDGRTAGDRIEAAGYDYRSYGENIAAGQDTPEEVMEGWMNSDGHRKNILNCGFTEIGVGIAKGGLYDGYSWTQNFGSR